MILYLRGHDLWRHPETARKMFKDRAWQFGQRRGWPVTIDQTGCETDQYDAEDPLYVIARSDSNPHEGSMRLMPMLGRTMIREHFPETLPKSVQFAHDVWECTRFCLAPGAGTQIGHALFACGGAYMAHRNITRMVAIFDEKMRRLHPKLGVVPAIIGAHRYGEEIYYAGSWELDEVKQTRLMQVAGLSRVQIAKAIAFGERRGGQRDIAA